jgi:hypothetical protein
VSTSTASHAAEFLAIKKAADLLRLDPQRVVKNLMAKKKLRRGNTG